MQAQAFTRTEGKLALFGGQPSFVREQHIHWPVITDEDRQNVANVLERGIFSGNFSPEVMALQDEFSSFVDADYCLATHSGTSALMLALAASGVGPGDEVIVPAYTFVATPLSVMMVGATPVFVDVQSDTGNMDPTLLEELISDRTRAIMPVHIHGCPADLDAIVAVANKFDLRVVEDAAQAHGATYKGKAVGAYHTAGGFSMQSSKNLCAGEGGLFVTNDPKVAELANSVRNFGQDLHLSDASSFREERALDGHRPLTSVRMGAMYRGNEMMAALGRSQLARLGDVTRACQKNAQSLITKLGELEGITPPFVPSHSESVHHKFRVSFDPKMLGLGEDATNHRSFRTSLLSALKAEGLEAVLWEQHPQNNQGIIRERLSLHGAKLPPRITRNYDASYPNAQRLLDTSILLFSQSCPLIAQSSETVAAYADIFEKVWSKRHELIVHSQS